MTLPEWIDPSLSRALPVHRAKGEGQHIEYMESFPDQVRELAKEIAAFATAGGGLILVGVGDGGELIGIDVEDPSKRDAYLKRIQGIASGTVNPPITPKVGFAQENGRSVLCIQVHKGPQPVYYCEGRPYIRHLTESRPAKPEEVIQRVLSWAGLKQSEEGIQDDAKSEPYWKSNLDRILVDLLIALDEMPLLSVNPGPDYLQSTCQLAASNLRSLIHECLQDEEAVAGSLRDLADKCDALVAVLSHRHSGTWDRLEHDCPPVRAEVAELRGGLLGGPSVDQAFEAEERQTIQGAVRKLRDLLRRADQMFASFRLNDVLYDASQIGGELIRYAYYPLDFMPLDRRQAFTEASRSLHLLQYHQQFFQCFGSEVSLKERIAEQLGKLEPIAASLA